MESTISESPERPEVDDQESRDRTRWSGVLDWLTGRRKVQPGSADPCVTPADDLPKVLQALARRPTSMTLRHLDCGSCNGCELQLIAMTNPCYDMEQYGISFEASPRHAMYLAMTGPFTRGLGQAAALTLDAMPMEGPRIIAIGDCAVNGNGFERSYAVIRRPADCKQVGPTGDPKSADQAREIVENAIKCEIPGCPPDPMDILKKLAELAPRITLESLFSRGAAGGLTLSPDSPSPPAPLSPGESG